MDEFDLIRDIKSQLKSKSKHTLVSIGDDTAVLRRSPGKWLATVDALVEGVHFDLKYVRPEELGFKALAVNLSDIAAMGGRPTTALVSLGLRNGVRKSFVRELYSGIEALAKEHKLEVVGGNISRSPKSLFVDVTVLGESKEGLLLRSGARAGDVIAVTGFLGSAALGLACLKKFGRKALRVFPELVQAQLRPTPRLKEVRLIQSYVNAAIDISDGLSSELHHIARQSKKGMLLEQAWVPIHPRAVEAAKRTRVSVDQCALHGGEDYELLVTIPESKITQAQKALRKLGRNLVVIGKVTKGSGVKLRNSSGKTVSLRPKGWRH